MNDLEKMSLPLWLKKRIRQSQKKAKKKQPQPKAANPAKSQKSQKSIQKKQPTITIPESPRIIELNFERVSSEDNSNFQALYDEGIVELNWTGYIWRAKLMSLNGKSKRKSRIISEHNHISVIEVVKMLFETKNSTNLRHLHIKIKLPNVTYESDDRITSDLDVNSLADTFFKKEVSYPVKRYQKPKLNPAEELEQNRELLGDCRHGIPTERCSYCASWGSNYSGLREHD